MSQIFLSEQILEKSESKVGSEFVYPNRSCKNGVSGIRLNISKMRFLRPYEQIEIFNKIKPNWEIF